VSETIRKAPLAEAQTALGKQNIFCGTPVSVSLPKFCKKTASPSKISLKSDNRLLSYGQKTILKMAAVCYLEF